MALNHPSMWECDHCRVANSMSQEVCIACGYKRGVSPTPQDIIEEAQKVMGKVVMVCTDAHTIKGRGIGLTGKLEDPSVKVGSPIVLIDNEGFEEKTVITAIERGTTDSYVVLIIRGKLPQGFIPKMVKKPSEDVDLLHYEAAFYARKYNTHRPDLARVIRDLSERLKLAEDKKPPLQTLNPQTGETGLADGKDPS